MIGTSRREFLAFAAGLLAWLPFARRAAVAAEEEETAPLPPREYALEQRLNPILAGRTPRPERVTLEMPEIAEDGRVVPVHIAVESPMTERDYVKALHLLVDHNPDPLILSIELSPRIGRAEWNVKIRMRENSKVRALAEMSDGALFTAEMDVVVNTSGCG